MRPLTIAHISSDQHRRSATSSAPSALCGGGHHEPVRRRHSLSHDLLPPSRGRGRRLPVTRVLRHWLRQRSVAALLQEAPGVSIEAKAAEMASLSDEERNALFEDLYGRKPESIEKVEQLLLAVHGELQHITAFQARLVICASKIIFSIESAKCKGFVLISDHSDASGASEEEREKVYSLYNVLFPMNNGGFPVTLRAIHRWNPPPIDLYGLYEKIDYVVSKELRVRITHITGETQEERFSKLAEYGIAKSSLPDVIGGDAKRLEWMQCVDRMVTEELSRAESKRNNQ